MSVGPFRYFNSGLFLGDKKYVFDIFSQIDWSDKRNFMSDQFLIRKKYHAFYPEIQIDWNCKIFQICYLKNDKIDNYVKFKILRSIL